MQCRVYSKLDYFGCLDVISEYPASDSMHGASSSGQEEEERLDFWRG